MSGPVTPYPNLPDPLRSFGASVEELLGALCEIRERAMDGTITPEHQGRLDAQLERVEDERAPILHAVESKIPTAGIILAEARASRDALINCALMQHGTTFTDAEQRRMVEDLQPLSRSRRSELTTTLQAELWGAADSVVWTTEDNDGYGFALELSNKVRRTGTDENGIPVFELRDTTVSQPLGADESAQGNPPTNPASKPKRVTVNNRMKAEFAACCEEVQGLTAEQWAKRLKCSETAIVESEMWKTLRVLRAEAKAARSLDRSRNGKKINRPK